jgi:hypothetical protein
MRPNQSAEKKYNTGLYRRALFVWCEESDRLLHEYNSAVLEVSRAVGKFADLAGTKSDADYYRLLGREKDWAKALPENARFAYEHHMTEHGCGERTTR